MSDEQWKRLWWHQRPPDSLHPRRVFVALRQRYHEGRGQPEIAALGEFVLRIGGCRIDIEYSLFRHEELPSSQQLIDFVLHHVPFRSTVTVGVLDMLAELGVERVPGAYYYPPCGMTGEELRQLNYLRGQILTFRAQEKRMAGWSPAAIKAELLVPRNHRVVLTLAGCTDYTRIEDFYQEELGLSLQFEQLEEYYAIYRCYPPGGDRYGRSHFAEMVETDLHYLASFVRHLDWMLPKICEQPGE
jgi:hypothetical protein